MSWKIYNCDFWAIFALAVVMLCQPLVTRATNAYGDHGIVITAFPTNVDTFQHVIAIPTTPLEIDNYTSRTFPGIKFQSLQRLYLACDVDYGRNEIYLYDFDQKDITLGTNFNTSMLKDEMEWSRVHYVSREIARIAVDWVSHNIYFTNPLMGWIAMQPGGVVTDTTLYKVIMNDKLHLPRGIAVDPLAGYIFWTDYSKQTSKIERASLIGTDRTTLVVSALRVPSAIVADPTSRRIFWTDGSFINSASYDGSNRIQLVSYSQASFIDISIFQDTLMVTDQALYKVFFYDTTTGEQAVQSIGSADDRYIGVCMYHADNQPVSPAGDLCSGYGCQDICVMMPDTTAASGATPTCVCRDGYATNTTDPKKCTQGGGQYHRAVIFNNQKDLCKLDINILTDHAEHTHVCFYEHPPSLNENISHIDLNMNTREVYFATKNKLYSVPIDQSQTQPAIELTSIIESRTIMGMSYDWVNRHIYWTESLDGKDGSINMLDPVTKNNINLSSAPVSGLTEITVVPHEGKLLWIAANSDSQIDINVSDLGASIDNVTTYAEDWNFDPRRILVHEKYHRVMVLATSDLYTFSYEGDFRPQSSFLGGNDDIFMDVEVYQDQVLLLDVSKDGVNTLKSSKLNPSTYALSFTSVGSLDIQGEVYNIRILDEKVLQPAYKSPCRQRFDDDTACDHMCVAAGSTSTCFCETGFILADNGFSCVQAATPVKDDFVLFTDMYHNKLFQIDLANTDTVIGIEVDGDKGGLSGVLYDYQRDLVVYSSRGSSAVWEVALNGSNPAMVADTGSLFAEPEFLALDPSTGDIYYSAVSEYADIFSDSFIGVMSPNGYDTILVYEGHSPRGIVLHPELGLMFWTDHGFGEIVRANMDGSKVTTIVEEDIQWPNGLAISYKTPANESLLYWSDGYYDVIYSCDLNGNSRTQIHEDPNAHLMGLAFLDGFLYYTAWDNTFITKLNIENTSDVTTFGPPSGIGRLFELDVYSAAHVANIPINAACSNNNGGCSHFCLPKENGEHTCGCHFPYVTLSDGRTCENVPRCWGTVPHGRVTEDDMCLRLEGNVCEFTCYERFTTNVASLTCQAGGFWDNPNPCEDLLCPATIPNVFLPSDCDRMIDGDCIQYACAAGFEKNADITELVCQDDGTWNADLATLCIEKCPALDVDVDMADLTSSCDRTVDETCIFVCKERYRLATAARSITCEMGSEVPEWRPPTRTLCEEVRCSPLIEDGAVNASSCSMLQGAACTYTCDDLYAANSDVTTITCTATGVWSHLATNDVLCVVIPRPVPQSSKSDDATKVGVGVGVGLGVLLIILIIIILIFLFRTGRLGSPKPKPAASAPGSVSFENPRYQESRLGSGGQTNSEFGYATLAEDRIELKDELSTQSAATAKNTTYDNAY